jgi:hypothetical protein
VLRALEDCLVGCRLPAGLPLFGVRRNHGWNAGGRRRC